MSRNKSRKYKIWNCTVGQVATKIMPATDSNIAQWNYIMQRLGHKLFIPVMLVLGSVKDQIKDKQN